MLYSIISIIIGICIFFGSENFWVAGAATVFCVIIFDFLQAIHGGIKALVNKK
jgi:hypothetical protein